MIALRRHESHTSGFTLVEVAAAVALLGIGLTTLMTLLTRVMDSYSRERNLFRASLYAQYLMTLIEVAQADPEAGSKESDLTGELKQAGYFDNDQNGFEAESIKNWKLIKTVTGVEVPPLPDPLRRIDLIVQWGDTASDSFRLVYFIKTTTAKQAPSSGQLE